MMNSKQIEALKQLAIAPAYQNRAGAPIGVAKLQNGATLNGNMIRNLEKLGLIETIQTEETRPFRTRGVNLQARIVKYEITEAGREAIR